MSTPEDRDERPAWASDDGGQLIGLMGVVLVFVVMLTVVLLPFGRASDLRANAVSGADAAALAAAADLGAQWRALVARAEVEAEQRAAAERQRRTQARARAEEEGDDPEELPDPADVRVVVEAVDLGELDADRAASEAFAWAARNQTTVVGFEYDALVVTVLTESDARLREGVASPTALRAAARAQVQLEAPPFLLPVGEDVGNGGGGDPGGCVDLEPDDDVDPCAPAEGDA